MLCSSSFSILIFGLCLLHLGYSSNQSDEITESELPTIPISKAEAVHVIPVTVGSRDFTENSLRKEFKDAEKAIIDYVNSLLRQLLPHVMKSGRDAMSPRCMSAMVMSFAGLKRLSGWTLKLLDSMAKPEAGLLTGRPFSFGDYDQCLAISVPTKSSNPKKELFRGKYCKIMLQQNPAVIKAGRDYRAGRMNVSELGKLKEMIESAPLVPVSKDYMIHRMGICMPSLCNKEDVAGIVQTFPFPGVISVESCETRNSVSMDLQQRTVIILIVILIFLLIISTITDKLLQAYPEEESSRYIRKKCVNIVVSFSICSNTKKLIHKMQNDSEEVPDWRPVRGLTVVAVICLVFYNTYLPPFEEFFRQASYLKNLESYFQESLFNVIVGLPLAIEILFFSCGFLITNKVWKSTWKDQMVKLNVVKIAVYSYFGLCVPLLFCNGVVVLVPMLGSGPFWNSVFSPHMIANCKSNWWPIVGMYGNFFHIDEQCFPHFWFVPCLMQIIILSLVFMLTIARWPRFGSFLTLLAVVGCDTAVGMVTLKNNLPPSYVDYFADRKTVAQWKVQQSLPLVHFASFAFGMMLGVFLARKTNIRINRFFVLFGWIVAIGLATGLFILLRHFYAHSANTSYVSGSTVYAALQTTIFSIVLVWIIWASAFRCGGFIGSFLSWSALDPLYKLSYLAYLLHLVIIAVHCGASREHFHYSHMEMMLRGTSYVVFSYAAAYVAYMLIVMPFKSLHAAICCSQSQTMTISSPSTNGYKKNNNYDNFFKDVA